MTQEPVAPSFPQASASEAASVLVTPPPPPTPQRSLFATHRSDGRDALGIEETLSHLAELALHKGTQGPVCIGLLGGAGTGKSFALARLGQRISHLAEAAGAIAQSPFVSRVHLESIDAATLEDDPALGVAARLHAGLRQAYPDLASEIGATARDPHIVLRDASEKLDEARRRLDSERRALDDAGSRRARLTETVLYESAGSQVDAYARANRAGIESRLSGFGIAGEPVRTYKDLVQLVAGSGGTLGLALRSLWAFKGQTKLIVLAIALIAVGVGLGIAVEDQSLWLDSLRSGPKAGGSVADWFQMHMGLLATAQTAAYGLAALALVANILRAINFLRPVVKGARLLESDLDERRRDLDGLYAHQTKRVDALGADVERLTREVAEAERRAGGRGAGEPSPFTNAGSADQGRKVCATLTQLMADSRSAIETPQRIVLAVDHLDALAPDRARSVLDALHRASGPGIVTIVGADPGRLDPAGTQRDALERWIQVPVRLDAITSGDAHETLIREALGHDDRSFTPTKPDARRSDLDAQVEDEEAALLVSLAGLAGGTPRAVRRFANLYQLARLGEERRLGLLAFLLAAAQGASPAERQAIVDALAGEPTSAFDLSQAGQRLRDGLALAVAVGGRVTKADARDAQARAMLFSLG